MRIGIVAGLELGERDLEDIALARGDQLELHTGVVAGPASAAGLRALVTRSDLVIVVTEVTSHNGVRMARRQARISRRSLRLLPLSCKQDIRLSRYSGARATKERDHGPSQRNASPRNAARTLIEIGTPC